MAVRTTKLGPLINLYNFMPPPLSRTLSVLFILLYKKGARLLHKTFRLFGFIASRFWLLLYFFFFIPLPKLLPLSMYSIPIVEVEGINLDLRRHRSLHGCN